MPVFLLPFAFGLLGGIGVGAVALNATEQPPVINTSPQPVQPPSTIQTVAYASAALAVIWAANKAGLIK